MYNAGNERALFFSCGVYESRSETQVKHVTFRPCHSLWSITRVFFFIFFFFQTTLYINTIRGNTTYSCCAAACCALPAVEDDYAKEMLRTF